MGGGEWAPPVVCFALSGSLYSAWVQSDEVLTEIRYSAAWADAGRGGALSVAPFGHLRVVAVGQRCGPAPVVRGRWHGAARLLLQLLRHRPAQRMPHSWIPAVPAHSISQPCVTDASQLDPSGPSSQHLTVLRNRCLTVGSKRFQPTAFHSPA